MSDSMRRRVLRANGIFLVVAGGVSMSLDLRAYFFGGGPQSVMIRNAPDTVIGFVEAHGLALIIGILLLRAAVVRPWHLAAAGVHVLLGGSNLLFWNSFSAAGMLAVGYVTTAFHGVFVVLELWAAGSARPSALGPPEGEPRAAMTLR